ncbi:winged helix-turn-helix domain-containing protein [Granulicella mallensis]|uniref:Tol biopolymer transport system component/DNA-binding winged helix-turn-helix (WHTH) protein n=1 Tax=Granulicella mallensis TaxID=940614 RepID=A0A7W8ECF5_9BACT|nr:winged helix-turn-helix domain-containing protein [Granulicella mallensis]MBB5066646.1 Tol biopolymer transport system component/DNA-binding winged helix-turn-helix (wHTH) protein [Granulicella mallensis]
MIFKFDRYTLNVDTRTLRCRDDIVTLTPKVFQTLLVLVENHTRVMSKDELFEHIWPHQTVEEANLTQNISILRKALEETTYGKRYIATFHGHGYRFVEPVSVDGGHPLLAATDIVSVEDTSTDVKTERASASNFEIPNPPGARQNYEEDRKRNSSVVVLLVCIALSVLLLILLIKMRRKNLPAVASQPAEVTTLTRMEGAQYEPSWSADGTKLAFISADSNNSRFSIYIQSSDELRPQQIVSGTGEYSSPAWSPDGKSLAFIHLQDDLAEILVVSIADAKQRSLTTLFPHRYGLNYRHLDWSPDGGFLVVDDKNNEIDPLSLYLVRVADGKKLRLTYPTMDIIGDVSPRFSPDGTHVAFIRVKYQFENDVFVLSVGGGEARKLTEQSHSLGDVDWATNDSVIFSGRLDREFKFWRQDLNATEPYAVLASSVGTDMPSQFSISRRAKQIAFSAHSSDLNIWSVPLAKKPPLSADWGPVIRTPGQDFEPSFSPDGEKIAFRSDTSGRVQLWVSKKDGTGAAKIDTGKLIPSVYCWERNSQALIFSSISAPGLFEVSLSQEHGLRHLTDIPLSHPSCPVEGKFVFASHSNFVYRISIADGAVLKITDQGGTPAIQSTDGRSLYFAQGRMDPTLSRLDPSTEHQNIVVSSLMPGYSDSWILTSKGLIFIKMISGRPVICFHDLASGKETVVAEFNGNLPPVGLSGFSLSPDERQLLVVLADPVSANIQATDLRMH